MKSKIAVVMSTTIAINAMGSIVVADQVEENISKNLQSKSVYPNSQMVEKPEEFLKKESNWKGPDVIEDNNLRFMINSRYNREGTDEELSKMPVTKEMVSNLRVLSPEQWKPHDSHEVDFMVKSLKGLEYADNLEWLSLVNQQEDSLEPIRNCKKLRHLDIRNNDNVKDISALENLTNLEELDMRSIKVDNINGLAKLTKLRNLCAFSCGINDITPLENLVNLERAELEYNNFSDISALKNLTKLKYLDISKLSGGYGPTAEKETDKITDISALENLINLEDLSISSNDIKDLSPLKNMKKLKFLSASNNLIEDWSTIDHLNIETVYDQGNVKTYNKDSKPGGLPTQDKEKKIFDIESFNSELKFEANDKEDAIKKLPSHVAVKVKEHNPNFKYSEGIYKKSTIRYIIKDENGNIVKDDLSFEGISADKKSNNYSNLYSKDGYLDIKVEGVPRNIDIKLNSDKYELVGDYKFKENTCTEGYHIDWLEKNSKQLKTDPLKPKNGSTFHIEEKDKDLFVINVKTKPNKTPEDTTTKEYFTREKVNFVIKDENGKIVDKKMLFDLHENSDGYNRVSSNSGYLIIDNSEGLSIETNIYLLDDEYELDGNYKVNGKFGSPITSVEKNYNKLSIEEVILEGTYKIPDDKKDILVINVKNKSNKTPEDTTTKDNSLKGSLSGKSISYLVKDTNGKIIKEKIKFKGITDAVGSDIPSIYSNDGRLDFKLMGDDRLITIDLDDESDYRIVGKYGFSEKYFDEKKNIEYIFKDNKKYYLNELNSDNTYDLPEDLLTIILKKKDEISVDKLGDEKNLNNLYLKEIVNMPSSLKRKSNEEHIELEDIEIPVSWSLNTKDSNEEEGILIFDGQLKTPENVYNRDELSLKATVKIKSEKISKPSSSSSSSSKRPGRDKNSVEDNKSTLAKYKSERVAGKNRIDTSVKLSKKYYKKAETVILVNGYNYPDALVSSSLSSAMDAPILLVGKSNIDAEVVKEIERLGAKKVVIIGGEASISEKAIKDSNINTNIERLNGRDRFETSSLIHDKLDKLGKINKTAILVSGENYPDALSASTISTNNSSPVLLARKNSIDTNIKYRLKSKDIENVIIVGGKSSISEGLESEIGKSTRISGKDRYETSMNVAKYQYSNAKESIIVSGESYADALSVGGVLSQKKSPLILTTRYETPESIKNYVNGLEKIEIVGGEKTIDKSQFK